MMIVQRFSSGNDTLDTAPLSCDYHELHRLCVLLAAAYKGGHGYYIVLVLVLVLMLELYSCSVWNMGSRRTAENGIGIAQVFVQAGLVGAG